MVEAVALCAHPPSYTAAWPAQPSPSLPFSLFQDALLTLGSVIDFVGLRRAAKEALSAVLPRVVGAHPHPASPVLHRVKGRQRVQICVLTGLGSWGLRLNLKNEFA